MVAHPQIDLTTPDHIMALRTAQTELARAVGRGQPALRDPSGNILALNPASSTPLLTAQGHDVALSMRSGFLAVTDETGQQNRGVYSDFVGAATYVSTATVYSDTVAVGTQLTAPTVAASDSVTAPTIQATSQVTAPTINADNAYTTLHGDSNGTHNGTSYGNHYGNVGASGQPFDMYGTNYGEVHGNSYGNHYGNVGVNGGPTYDHFGNSFGQLSGDSFGTHNGTCYGNHYGNVGSPGNNYTYYGTVVAPSERALKTDITSLSDAGDLVDSLPVYRWRWGPGAPKESDTHEHVGVMADDLDLHAPWLVRHPEPPWVGGRGYNDRDLIGVLWAALRDTRAQVATLEARVAAAGTP